MVTQQAIATTRSVVTRIIAAALVITTAATAQPPMKVSALQTATVHGKVFDSLTMAPIEGALVWIEASTLTAVTDKLGKFTLDNVNVGKQRIAFSSTSLDSTGLGSIARAIDVGSSGVAETLLATPSFNTVWRSLCAGEKGAVKDSGIVWGTIRDAREDTRLSGAAAVFRWYDLHTNTVIKKLEMSEISKSARTDSIGNYYACGLPADVAITTQAAGDKSASGALEHVIGVRRVARLDLSVSSDMVLSVSEAPGTTVDTASITHVRGTSTLRGVVRDDKGKPMANATVFFATADSSVRSGKDGTFILTSMPAGTHAVQARQIGFRPVTITVDLKPGATTHSDLQMYSGQELATVTVRADTKSGRDRAGYLDRRRTGFGYAVEGDFSNKFDTMAILRELGANFTRTRDGEMALTSTVLGRIGATANPCPASLYVDGIPASADQLAVYAPEYIRAAEVYPSRLLIPFGYSQGANECGVVLVWTKKAKW